MATVTGGEDDESPFKSENEENNASSRFMNMIGVAGTDEAGGGGGGGIHPPLLQARLK